MILFSVPTATSTIVASTIYLYGLRWIPWSDLVLPHQAGYHTYTLRLHSSPVPTYTVVNRNHCSPCCKLTHNIRLNSRKVINLCNSSSATTQYQHSITHHTKCTTSFTIIIINITTMNDHYSSSVFVQFVLVIIRIQPLLLLLPFPSSLVLTNSPIVKFLFLYQLLSILLESSRNNILFICGQTDPSTSI